MNLSQKFYQAIMSLQHQQTTLLECLKDIGITYGVVSKLPTIASQETVAHTREINVEQLWDQEAKATGLQSLTNLFASDSHSTRFSERMPGVLCFDMEAAQELPQIVAGINEQKQMIKAMLQEVKDHYLRHKVVHDAFPMMVTLKVYRQLRLLQSATRIHFNWANKNSTTKITRDALLLKLQQQQEQLERLQQFDGASKVAQEIQLISGLSTYAPLRIHRSLPMQPMANINFKERQFICTNPILVMHPKGQLPSIAPLGSYRPSPQNETKFRRSNRMQPLLPRIQVYLKEPEVLA
jgi:DNA replication terminus site-binding protein